VALRRYGVGLGLVDRGVQHVDFALQRSPRPFRLFAQAGYGLAFHAEMLAIGNSRRQFLACLCFYLVGSLLDFLSRRGDRLCLSARAGDD
jgi:hypothetical protein